MGRTPHTNPGITDYRCPTCPRRARGHPQNFCGWGGNPNSDFVILGESPGRDELHHGTPFYGRAGTFLRNIMRACGIDIDSQCYILNCVNCYVLDLKTTEERADLMSDHCLNEIYDDIFGRKADVRVILTFGNVPLWGLNDCVTQEKRNALRVTTVWSNIDKLTCPATNKTAWVVYSTHPSHAHLMRNRGLINKRYFEHRRSTFQKKGKGRAKIFNKSYFGYIHFRFHVIIAIWLYKYKLVEAIIEQCHRRRVCR